MDKHAAVIKVILAKAQVLGDYTDMEELQDALQGAMASEWEARAGSVGPFQSVEAAVGQLNKAFSGWPSKGLQELVGESVEGMFKLAQKVILNKQAGTKGYDKPLVFKSLTPNFNLIDQQAVEYLASSQLFWMRDRYDTGVIKAIRDAAQVELEGLTGADAAAKLQDLVQRKLGIGDYDTASEAYWEMVAVNASTTSRVTGSLLEMEELEVTKYVITNPRDERTSDICKHMDGKTFVVADQVKVIKDIIAADDPAGTKELHPWHSHDFQDVFKDIGVSVQPDQALSDADAAKLAKAGFAMPPYHGTCRTTVDIA